MIEPGHIAASRDPRTGEHYYPVRALSVDGELRALEEVSLPGIGVLAEYVAMGERHYGYVDLPSGVRLIVELGAGPHQVGAEYRWDGAAGPRRFERA